VTPDTALHEEKTIMKFSILSTVVLALSTAAIAQTATPAPGNINGRKENQQDRIAQGVQSGSLSPSETARLESKQASINRQEHNMRAADNGHLTAQDRATLNRRQNRQSKAIFAAKHDGRGR
jgi:hypothetical protein